MPPAPAGDPAVSIIVATYNRSNVLGMAIESALAQTFGDWEMIVVGDACTDDTAGVVAGFGDPRISFLNLPVNHGDQSGPNNAGVVRAAGRYVAYLNHDDLWLDDHLASCVAALETGGADGVFAVSAAFEGGDTPILRPSWTGALESGIRAPASAWLIRRDAVERVGPWRPRHACFDAPSRDWLVRAARAGAVVRQLPRITVLVFPSGVKPGSYARRDSAEQRALWARMRDPGFREELLNDIAIDAAATALRPRSLSSNLHRLVQDLVARALGTRASTLLTVLRHRRRGGGVDALRRRRGLEAA